MDKKIRWGVLSTANIGTGQVIPAMQKGKFCEIAAIASRNKTRAEEVARKMAIPTAYGSYEELLLDNTIDAVYIPLPNHLHVEWCIKSMEAGKHVLCEKPLALTTAEITSLMEVRDRTGMKISEGFMVRSHPQWLKAREMVQSGALGKLTAIQGFFSYFNKDAKNIRNVAEYGGGSMWDIGCYPINTSRFVFSEEPLRVISLMKKDPDFNVDILASAILEYPSGQAVFTSGTQMAPYQRMTLIGTEKHLEIEIPFNSPNKIATRMFLSDSISREKEVIEIETCDQYTLQGDNFSKAIINNTEVPVPLEDTTKNTAVLNALFKSSTSGKWEDVTI